MPILANAGTFAPETVVTIEDTAAGGFPVSLPLSGALVEVVMQFQVPENEVWQVLYFGGRIEVSVIADVVIDGVHAFILNGTNPAARASATTSEIAATAPVGRFSLTPLTPYGDVGPGRTIGMSITLHNTNAGANRAVNSGNLSAEIRRFRLVTDQSVVTIPQERAALEQLNARLLQGSGR